MTAAILVPVVGFAVADTVKEEEWRWVDIGPLSGFPDGQTTSIAVSGPTPESDRRAYSPPGRGDHRDLEPLRPPGVPGRRTPLAATTTRAPATAAPTTRWAWSPAGPPPRPLDRFDVKLVGADGKDVAQQEVPSKGVADREGQARATACCSGAPFSIDAEQHPYELHGPGEPVTGVLANLYPLPRAEGPRWRPRHRPKNPAVKVGEDAGGLRRPPHRAQVRVEVVPLPQRPGRDELVPDPRLHGHDPVRHAGHHGDHPRDVLHSRTPTRPTRASAPSPTTSPGAGWCAACTSGAPAR